MTHSIIIESHKSSFFFGCHISCFIFNFKLKNFEFISSSITRNDKYNLFLFTISTFCYLCGWVHSSIFGVEFISTIRVNNNRTMDSKVEMNSLNKIFNECNSTPHGNGNNSTRETIKVKKKEKKIFTLYNVPVSSHLCIFSFFMFVTSL